MFWALAQIEKDRKTFREEGRAEGEAAGRAEGRQELAQQIRGRGNPIGAALARGSGPDSHPSL